MSHNHSCTCDHQDVQFCKHCQVVYCKACNTEWIIKSYYNSHWIYSNAGTSTGASTPITQTTGIAYLNSGHNHA